MPTNSNVISSKNSQNHSIDNYHFKVISEFASEQEKKQNEQAQNSAQQPQNEEAVAAAKQNFNSDFVENLLKKTDEMSNNILKLQMQIENQENEFKKRLESELENAKEKFIQEGNKQAKTELEQELNALKEKYLKSIAKLDEVCVSLNDFIQNNEKELANMAIEIAKEVIQKEVEQNSAQIALNLSKELMSKLKGASDIELRVNPGDYDFIKTRFDDLKHLKINLDDAISKGSVIAFSDMGNIESNLNSRLMKIKKMASE